MSIFWLTFEDFKIISERIVKTEGFQTENPIHPLAYYESDGIMYIYRAFGNVIYGTKVSMFEIEKEIGMENFHMEHLSKAIHLTEKY